MNESTKSAHRRAAWTLEKWQLAIDIPLTAAACLFLVAYAYQVLAQPTGLPHRLTEWTMWAAWVVFAVDYAVRLWLALPAVAGSSGISWTWRWWCCPCCVRCAYFGWSHCLR